MKQTTNYRKHNIKNPLARFFLNNFYTVIIAEIKKLKPESILDVGCGEGFTMVKLKNENIGNKIEGIEYLDESIKLGKKIHPDAKIIKGNIYKLPYNDNSFDLVICTEVLEHLDKPLDALMELKRVSKKHVLLSVPDEPLFTIQRFLRGKNITKFGDHPEHIQHWRSLEFKKFVAQALKICTFETPLPWTLIIGKKL